MSDPAAFQSRQGMSGRADSHTPALRQNCVITGNAASALNPKNGPSTSD